MRSTLPSAHLTTDSKGSRVILTRSLTGRGRSPVTSTTRCAICATWPAHERPRSVCRPHAQRSRPSSSAGGPASTSTAAGCGCRRGHTPGGSSRRTTAGRRGSARAATSRRNSRQASTGEVTCPGHRADRTARLRTACADGGIRRRGTQPAGERDHLRARHSEPARQQERVRVDDARSAGGAVAAAVQLQRIERRAEHRSACRLGKRRKPNDDRPADERVRCSATASVRHPLPLRRRQRHHRHVRLREHSSRAG